ncbi:hypothetical protein M436DRAFT_55283, partial [Aureobasidium namibiae CBS 147.97]
TNIDRRGCERVVAMEILSLGMGRTGTMSMKAAFEILGNPTYHYVSMMENPPDIDAWLELLEKKYPSASTYSSTTTTTTTTTGESPTLADLDALLGRVSAVTDSPANAFTAELISAYPSAKVILVERDVSPWYTSFEKNVICSFSSPLTRLVCLLDPGFVGKQGRLGQLVMQGQWQASSFAEWRANAKSIYAEHSEMIKAIVSKERLLVYKLGSGWQPLCDFLGKDVPKVGFPRVNETEEMKERVFLALMLVVRRAVVGWMKLLMWGLPLFMAVI